MDQNHPIIQTINAVIAEWDNKKPNQALSEEAKNLRKTLRQRIKTTAKLIELRGPQLVTTNSESRIFATSDLAISWIHKQTDGNHNVNSLNNGVQLFYYNENACFRMEPTNIERLFTTCRRKKGEIYKKHNNSTSLDDIVNVDMNNVEIF